jgi:predicted nucleotidyltransferase component of viral defense system
LLRLCYFASYRYSADLDFSAIDGLTAANAIALVATAVDACRRRTEAPRLDLSHDGGGTAWISYIGPLGSQPRKIKLNISDDELVEGHDRLRLHRRWPDLPAEVAIEGYTLDEVGAEKLRCVVERLQCRDLYDLHELFDGQQVDPMEIWHLYLRKAANDLTRGRQGTAPREWADVFDRRLTAYRDRWDRELGDYLSSVPGFGDIERHIRRRLSPILAAARALAER